MFEPLAGGTTVADMENLRWSFPRDLEALILDQTRDLEDDVGMRDYVRQKTHHFGLKMFRNWEKVHIKYDPSFSNEAYLGSPSPDEGPQALVVIADDCTEEEKRCMVSAGDHVTRGMVSPGDHVTQRGDHVTPSVVRVNKVLGLQ